MPNSIPSQRLIIGKPEELFDFMHSIVGSDAPFYFIYDSYFFTLFPLDLKTILKTRFPEMRMFSINDYHKFTVCHHGFPCFFFSIEPFKDSQPYPPNVFDTTYILKPFGFIFSINELFNDLLWLKSLTTIDYNFSCLPFKRDKERFIRDASYVGFTFNDDIYGFSSVNADLIHFVSSLPVPQPTITSIPLSQEQRLKLTQQTCHQDVEFYSVFDSVGTSSFLDSLPKPQNVSVMVFCRFNSTKEHLQRLGFNACLLTSDFSSLDFSFSQAYIVEYSSRIPFLLSILSFKWIPTTIYLTDTFYNNTRINRLKSFIKQREVMFQLGVD